MASWRPAVLAPLLRLSPCHPNKETMIVVTAVANFYGRMPTPPPEVTTVWNDGDVEDMLKRFEVMWVLASWRSSILHRGNMAVAAGASTDGSS